MGESEAQKKIEEAMETFRQELEGLRKKLDVDVEQIIAEAKQNAIEKLKQSLQQTNG